MSRFISALAGVGMALLSPMALAQDAAEAPAVSDTVDISALMAPGPLPEKTLGDISAPVTVVEYASMTCSHCGNFYRTTFAPFKEKYVDTGKVRFVFREFPLDQLALAAAALARCAPEDKFFDVVDAMFEKQAEWAYVERPGPALMNLVEPFGLDEDGVNACVADEKLVEGIISGSRKAGEDFGVNGTPAFFINGKLYGGSMTLADMEAAIEPLLATAN